MNALLLERHDWETSGGEHQIQIPKAAFAQFFGSAGLAECSGADAANHIVWANPLRPSLLLLRLGHIPIQLDDRVRLTPATPFWCSRKQEMNLTLLCLVVYGQRRGQPVLGQPYPWKQAKASQYGPGRKWVVIPTPAPRTP